MLEIIYRPLNEVGYFLSKGEFFLQIFLAMIFGALIFYFLDRTIFSQKGEEEKAK